MDKALINCLRNPIQSKLLLSIHAQGETTAKQLIEANKDIPQATLYRHLGKMTKDGMLKIVKETPIRGAVEKVYSLAIALPTSEASELVKLSSDAYMNMFTEYMMGLMGEFREYTAKEDIDITADGSGFSLTPIYATREELLEVSKKMTELLMPLYQNKSTPERRYQMIGIIVTPPKKIE